MLAVVYYMNVVKRCKAFYSGDNQLEKKEEAMQRVHLDIKKQNTIQIARLISGNRQLQKNIFIVLQSS